MATTGLAEVFPITAGLNNFHEVRRIAPNEVEGCSPSALTGQIELIDEQTPRLVVTSRRVTTIHGVHDSESWSFASMRCERDNFRRTGQDYRASRKTAEDNRRR